MYKRNASSTGRIISGLIFLGVFLWFKFASGNNAIVGTSININLIFGMTIFVVIIGIATRIDKSSSDKNNLDNYIDKREDEFSKEKRETQTEFKSIHENYPNWKSNSVEKPMYKPVVKPIEKPVAVAETGKFFCQDCHQPVNESTIYCPHCGSRIIKMVKCVECGHMNPDANVICEKCHKFIH